MNRGRLGGYKVSEKEVRVTHHRLRSPVAERPEGNVCALSNSLVYLHQAMEDKLDARRTCTGYLPCRMCNISD